MIIYLVTHNMGIDGNYNIAVFSKKEDAEKLCNLYNSIESINNPEYDNEEDSYSSYDFYSWEELIVDKNDINKYELISEDGWIELQYKEC